MPFVGLSQFTKETLHSLFLMDNGKGYWLLPKHFQMPSNEAGWFSGHQTSVQGLGPIFLGALQSRYLHRIGSNCHASTFICYSREHGMKMSLIFPNCKMSPTAVTSAQTFGED